MTTITAKMRIVHGGDTYEIVGLARRNTAIPAGDLVHVVTLQAPTEAQSGSGQPVASWSTYATPRAARRDNTARERLGAAGGQQAVADVVFTIRRLAGDPADVIGHEIMCKRKV